MKHVLSPDDLRWLTTRGGREEKDVHWEVKDGKEVKYILMDANKGTPAGTKEKVYF